MAVRKKTGRPESQIFAFRPIQKVIVGLLMALAATLVVTIFGDSLRARSNLLVLSDSASGKFELKVTQRESIVYVTEYGQWLSGLSTKRELQIRRALLGQRLVVKDTLGVPSGERVTPKYLQALAELDVIVASTKSGYLSTDESAVIRNQSKAALDTFLTEARAIEMQSLLASNAHQRTIIDQETRRRVTVYLIALTVNGLILVLVLFLAISRSRDYRRVRNLVLNERQQLVATQVALDRSRVEVREQVESEEARRREVFRLDSLSMSISSNIRELVDRHQIVDTLVAGVGTSIGADMVIFHSFPILDEPRILVEWLSKGEGNLEHSEFLRNEETLITVTTEMWNGVGVVTIPDSQLLDPATSRVSSLIEVIKQIARSWFTVPIGEGSRVLGYIAVLMHNEVREWSNEEIVFVQTLAANAANVMIHIRLVKHAAQIAEHDEVVRRLLEIDKTKSDFIANVNHELRTPLTSIIGYLEIIRDSADMNIDSATTQLLDTVTRNAIRLQTLVENTLLISLLDSQRLVFDAAPVDVEQLLRTTVDSLMPRAQSGGVEMNLVVEDKERGLRVEGNGNQIEQVFENLISNAVKFTPKGGTVTVTARHVDTENGAVVEVTVGDTGIGIPLEEAAGMFQRFARASNALRAAIPGSGLGLAIVKVIVDMHGGSVTFTSKMGEGTVFTVRLPVFRSAKPEATGG